MISPEISTSLTLCIFILATLGGFWGILARNLSIKRLACLLAVLGFICQTAMLALGFHKAGLSVGAYMQLLAWFLVLCGIGIWYKFKQDTILLFSAPFCLILFAGSESLLKVFIQIPEQLNASFYTLHIGSLFLSLALLLLASVASLLFLVLHKRLKKKHTMKGLWQDLPALAILEKIAAITTALAFPLYTLGIISGLLWAKPVFGTTLSGDPKEIASVVIWLLFALLFHGRFVSAWKGRKPAKLTLVILVLSLLSFLVINTFMDTHHSFNRI